MKNSKNKIELGERGTFNKNNKLNELTGKEWIKFSKSWFIHRPVRRKENEILHPAKYPESLVEEFINFFTKKGDWIFDPFMGTGSTLVAAGACERNAIGVELQKEYFNITSNRINKSVASSKLIPLNGNSLELEKLFKDKLESIPEFSFVITSPPYWNQLERNSIRQKVRSEKGLSTKYSADEDDIGNIEDYEEFLERQAKIFDAVFDFVKPNGYLAIITNNVYYKSKLYPLAFDTATSLTKRGEKSWVLKDEKIWLQDDKALIALGINSAWVSNRHHQYCLIFRKEV